MAREVEVRMRRIPVNGGVPRMMMAVRNNASGLSYHFAQRVEGGAKRRVHVITGNLRNSITRIRIAKYRHRVVVGAYYGIYEEMGTRYRPPHPYFRPAVAAAKAQYQREKVRVFSR